MNVLHTYHLMEYITTSGSSATAQEELIDGAEGLGASDARDWQPLQQQVDLVYPCFVVVPVKYSKKKQFMNTCLVMINEDRYYCRLLNILLNTLTIL